MFLEPIQRLCLPVPFPADPCPWSSIREDEIGFLMLVESCGEARSRRFAPAPSPSHSGEVDFP